MGSLARQREKIRKAGMQGWRSVLSSGRSPHCLACAHNCPHAACHAAERHPCTSRGSPDGRLPSCSHTTAQQSRPSNSGTHDRPPLRQQTACQPAISSYRHIVISLIAIYNNRVTMYDNTKQQVTIRK